MNCITRTTLLAAMTVGMVGAPATAQELLDATSWMARPEAVARVTLQDERLPRDVKRWRPVDIRMDSLSLARTPGTTADLTLFDDTSLSMVIDTVTERAIDDVSFTGRVPGASRSMVNIVQKGDIVLMDVWTLDMGTYHVRYAGDGVHVVREIDATVKGQCGLDDQQVTIDAAVAAAEPAGPPAIEAPAGAGGGGAAAGSMAIDVLIAYTPAARSEQGGTAAIAALAQLVVDGANQIYSNSLSTDQLNLVGTAEVSYSETAGEDMITLRNRLRGLGDGFMEEIHAWQDAVGADLVSLLCSDQVDIPNLYGIAYITNANDPGRGYNVTKGNAATAPNWTFAHEVGHNHGCRHDHNNNPGSGLPNESSSSDDHASYSWGHYFDEGGFCESFVGHTLMARLANPGSRIDVLSTPNIVVEINGGFPCFDPIPVPLGVDEGQPNPADNARSHTERRPIMAAWVGDPVELFVDFSCPAPTTEWWICSVADGVHRVQAGGTLRLVPGSSSETLTITKAITLTSTGGPVTIGN